MLQSEIRVESAVEGRTVALSRQAIRSHLEILVREGYVTQRPSPRGGRSTLEYFVNNQRVFSLAEDLKGLAKYRPQVELNAPTELARRPQATELKDVPALVMVRGLEEGTRFPLSPSWGTTWNIGRQRQLPVPLDYDPFVSNLHATVRFESGGYFLEGAPKAKNGTFLNFQLLAPGNPARLRHGDLIQIGKTSLQFWCP